MPATPEAREMDTLQHRVDALMRPFAARAAVLPIEAAEIPPPYRALLAHNDGMTPTLASYWKQPIHLRPLAIQREGDLLMRQVVLVASRAERAVGFGTIRIHLDRFAPEARPRIVAGETPLGAILLELAVEHRGQHTGFFEVESDALTDTGFDLSEPHRLYGRHNLLLTPSGDVLAEVVEILPPIERDEGRA